MAAIQLISSAPLQDPTLPDRIANQIVELLALLLPALDRMTQTTWLWEPGEGSAALVAVFAQTLIYLVLIGAASLFDLYRKNF
jgi:Cu-processing system permease protein